MIRVVLPHHLRQLANLNGEIELQIDGEVTACSILDALEARYPVLRGTIRDQVTKERRAFIRFFACGKDPLTIRLTRDYRNRWPVAANVS